ncbi:MAG: hypothetical protein H7126_00390 [Candidatus Parcubacteria bacterium]|uniref:hypothetical protein n=1 Tax=Phormidesmis priestleyi TaxID=268141 RepID=UPI00083A9817|nr:hypothetical protein [Phormidesmis priestleyi]MBC7822337.1 hypothetical protein [Leptolyngbyaceae cyanobacterium LF-bin-113]
MSELKRHAVDPESIEAYRIRVLFHCEELHREKHAATRAMIALYLAEAAATLARLEVEEAQKTAAIGASPI